MAGGLTFAINTPVLLDGAVSIRQRSKRTGPEIAQSGDTAVAEHSENRFRTGTRAGRFLHLRALIHRFHECFTLIPSETEEIERKRIEFYELTGTFATPRSVFEV